MKLFLKLSAVAILFTFISCKKTVSGITLPNLENTTWSGTINNTDVLTFNFQKNGILKVTASDSTPKDTTGTWQVKDFSFSAQFVDRSKDTILFKAPISNTKLDGIFYVNSMLIGVFTVQKQ